MNATLQIIGSFLLAAGSFLTAGGLIYLARENKRLKQAEIEKAKKEAERTEKEVYRTEVETTEIAEKAASINETTIRERERWWQQQFGTLRDEFESERELSVQRFRQLNDLERYMDELMVYVRSLVRRLRALDEEVADPPTPPGGFPRSKV